MEQSSPIFFLGGGGKFASKSAMLPKSGHTSAKACSYQIFHHCAVKDFYAIFSGAVTGPWGGQWPIKKLNFPSISAKPDFVRTFTFARSNLPAQHKIAMECYRFTAHGAQSRIKQKKFSHKWEIRHTAGIFHKRDKLKLSPHDRLAGASSWVVALDF
jgi:hypothetical protein